MALPTNPLDLAILLRREMLQTCINEDGCAEGIVPAHLDFQEVLESLDDCNLRGPSDYADLRKLEFSLPAHYYLSIDALLQAHGRRVQPPDDFYLEDLDYRHSIKSSVLPEVVAYYLQATRLFKVLSLAADDERRLAGAVTLVFLNQQKLEITADYTAEHLKDLPALDEFEQEYAHSLTHKQQKATIFRDALFSLFSREKKIPLSSVLMRFTELIEHVERSYQLYVSEFSFHKVKADVEKEKLELTVKLNKVFSDIQNQLLAVPAALVLVGGQMEATHIWSIKNLLVWSGAFVFAVLMNLLIRNQRHSLNAVKVEIDQQWELIEGRHRQVAQQFKDSYTQLDDRYDHQRRLLWTVGLLVSVALGFATALLLWYSVSELLAIQSMMLGVLCALVLYALSKISCCTRILARFFMRVVGRL